MRIGIPVFVAAVFECVELYKSNQAMAQKMPARFTIIAAFIVAALPLGCQWLPNLQLTSLDGSTKQARNYYGTVTVGSITKDGLLECKLNKIERGMARSDVELILGRKADMSLWFSSCMGDQTCYWEEEQAWITLTFDFDGKLTSKTIACY